VALVTLALSGGVTQIQFAFAVYLARFAAVDSSDITCWIEWRNRQLGTLFLDPQQGGKQRAQSCRLMEWRLLDVYDCCNRGSSDSCASSIESCGGGQ